MLSMKNRYLLTAGTLCYLNRQDYHLFENMNNLNQVNLLYLGAISLISSKG
ncbi:Uncharacterised protein [Raoultella terrigena]|uniref:Uncharacterized protein n=1 Tax=Raoultella terrigena TaxID=577 RepID=A0A3P8IVS0_RAOTE|nr:Uncharacterised protein [Raoultella terrigena]